MTHVKASVVRRGMWGMRRSTSSKLAAGAVAATSRHDTHPEEEDGIREVHVTRTGTRETGDRRAAADEATRRQAVQLATDWLTGGQAVGME